MTAPTAEDLRHRLGLVAHPTCGYVAETYRATERIAPGGLGAPFGDGRPIGTALTFLVAPEAPVRLHRIRNDQIYLYQLGDPLEVLLLHPDGGHGEVVVGPDPAAGHRLHLVIRGGTFHTARLAAGGGWFLGSSAEWPGVEPQDVEPGDLEDLAARYPAAADRLRGFLADG
jgi:predicted cupin superfamily sugar epimerase